MLRYIVVLEKELHELFALASVGAGLLLVITDVYHSFGANIIVVKARHQFLVVLASTVIILPVCSHFWVVGEEHTRRAVDPILPNSC